MEGGAGGEQLHLQRLVGGKKVSQIREISNGNNRHNKAGVQYRKSAQIRRIGKIKLEPSNVTIDFLFQVLLHYTIRRMNALIFFASAGRKP